jgi:spore germination cell wall hydrolase CwlJ-like protein
MTISELVVATVLSISPVSEANASDNVWLNQQIECMAQNVYHEARSQGTAGRLAVMAVTSNRVQDHRYPNTVCEVVKQGPHRPSWKGTGELIPVRHRCQFSWYCDGKSDKVHDLKTYNEIRDLSALVVRGDINVIDITEGATHYHADYVSPDWAKTKTKTIEIEDHIFYRWEK